MGAFSTAFSDFCDGHAALPQLLAVLRDDLLSGHQAAFDNATLIDRAWQSGRVDREVYETLRDTITNFDISASQRGGVNDSSWEEIRVSRDDWHMDAFGPDRRRCHSVAFIAEHPPVADACAAFIEYRSAALVERARKGCRYRYGAQGALCAGGNHRARRNGHGL